MSNLLEDLDLVEDLPQCYAYTIADDSELVMDRRKDRTLRVNHKEVYFVGHRIMEPGEFRFHLAVIVADDMGSFIRTLREVQEQIRISCDVFSRSLLVYVRNLYSFDRDLQASASHQEIAREIVCHQLRDESEKYLVYSLLGGPKLCLQTTCARDVLAGITSCHEILAEHGLKDSMILKACLMQSISVAFDCTIESRVEQLKTSLHTLPDPAATWR